MARVESGANVPSDVLTGLDGRPLTIGVDDSRRVITYMVVRESDDYLAVMDVLEASVTDLMPVDVAAALSAAGSPLDVRIVESRLEALRTWGAVSARSDTSRIQRYTDLLARNWRYTATPAGRQAQRFYRTFLAGTPTLREIPLTSLGRIVSALNDLVDAVAAHPPDWAVTGLGVELVDLIGAVFTSHDDLDGALVGAEDALAALADRFDLDDERTAELKGLLVDYATRVAAELDGGSARAAATLRTLRPHFAALADLAVVSSDARVLIERGALTASRGGRVEDWEGLCGWFDARTGRAARFSLRLVRSLPGMHANLRRLHTSSGTATTRSRALALARAAADPEFGTQVWQAALGDHPWRKLHGTSSDEDTGSAPPWRTGPRVDVPELLRSTGRAGPRGKGGAARDDTQARADVAAARHERQLRHDRALREVLAAAPGDMLSEDAARVALASLMAATRATASGARRTASRDQLACSLVFTGIGTGVLCAPTWQVRVPGRHMLFHLPGGRPNAVTLATVTGAARPDPSAHSPATLLQQASPSTMRRGATAATAGRADVLSPTGAEGAA